MSEIRNYIKKALDLNNLSQDEAARAMQIIASGGSTPAQIAAYLTALSVKGISSSEIIGSASFLKSKLKIKSSRPAFYLYNTPIDTLNSLDSLCGSTFILNAAGINTLTTSAVNRKHSLFNTILSSWGYNIHLEPEEDLELFDRIGIAFSCNRLLLPRLVDIPFISNELGFENLFDIIEPLISPAIANQYLIGLKDKNNVLVVLESLKELGYGEGWVYCGENFSSHFSYRGNSFVAALKNNKIYECEIVPEDFGLDREVNLKNNFINRDNYPRVLYDFLSSGSYSEYMPEIFMQTATAFFITGIVDSLEDGITFTQELIESKKVYEAIKNAVCSSNQFILSRGFNENVFLENACSK